MADMEQENDWPGFARDAAQTIRAREGFEAEAANVVDAPWDQAGHERLRNALAALQEAVPAARRLRNANAARVCS